MYGNITKYFSFIDFKRQKKLKLSAIDKMYIVSALFENAHTCPYSNIVLTTFELEPPTLEELLVNTNENIFIEIVEN